MTQSELFQTAVKKAKAGDRSQAQTLLRQLVESNPQHELAWLWLSELVESPEEKLIALENALIINPSRSQTQVRLSKLQQKFPHLDSKDDNLQFNSQEEQTFAQIERHLLEGDVVNGQRKLATFLHTHTDHKAAWWLMAQYADSQINQLLALDHLLRLNPHHADALTILNDVKPAVEESLQMGRIYERVEDWETAVRYYKRALRSSHKQKAQQRLPHAERQLKLSKIKTTSPTATVLRLAIGPTLLYTLLLLIESGLNPLQLSPLLCLGNSLFLAGLLLRGGLSYAPDHNWLEQLRETAVFRQDRYLYSASRLFIILPILFLGLFSLSRLFTLIQKIVQP